MNKIETMFTRTGLAVTFMAVALLVAGCARKQEEATPAAAQGFDTPEAVVTALVAALQKSDLAAAAKLLGPGSEELLSSGDAIADKADLDAFLADYAAKNSIATEGDQATLIVGANDWPLPIPLVKKDGKWSFDATAGVDEMIYRRVGANELGAIDVMYGYVNAQNAYAAEGRDGDPAGILSLIHI